METLEDRRLLAGVVADYPLPSTLVVVGGITTGPDGNLWFNATFGGTGGGRIGRITTGGSTTLFPVSGNPSNPLGITAGPDGALWFTDASGSIGRITTSGAVTEFPTPTAFSAPSDITVGSDGNLWFAEAGANKIGRITTGGVITEFPTTTAESEPAGITAGPDGNLWFVEEMANKIGRITPGGAITEFPIPTAFSESFGITAGPDGALWFTEQTKGKIGRITTDGAITEFSIPSGGGEPLGITPGPDGNLWFAESLGAKIGRITPSGVITEFSIPTVFSQPFDITTGPDGDLWFTSGPATFTFIGKVSPRPTSQTQLAAEPVLSAPGQPVTLTATVSGDGTGITPTGSVSFSIDGGPATTVPLVLVGGQEQATLSISTLALGSHSVVASYGGVPGLDASAAVIRVAVVSAPTVTSVQRFGFHAQPTSIVLGFSSPLDPARAQDLRNYRIVGPEGQAVAIVSAVYSPIFNTVTLTPRSRLDLHRLYRLTVNGAGAGGLTDEFGIPLDGANNGGSGSDFVTELDAADLVLGAQVPGGPARLASLRDALSKIEKDQAKQLARLHHSSTSHAASRAVPARSSTVVARHHPGSSGPSFRAASRIR